MVAWIKTAIDGAKAMAAEARGTHRAIEAEVKAVAEERKTGKIQEAVREYMETEDFKRRVIEKVGSRLPELKTLPPLVKTFSHVVEKDGSIKVIDDLKITPKEEIVLQAMYGPYMPGHLMRSKTPHKIGGRFYTFGEWVAGLGNIRANGVDRYEGESYEGDKVVFPKDITTDDSLYQVDVGKMRSMSSAPRDGTPVDLFSVRGCRVPDARWTEGVWEARTLTGPYAAEDRQFDGWYPAIKKRHW